MAALLNTHRPQFNATQQLVAISLVLIIGRLIPHPWNMTPTLALTLLCGRWLSQPRAITVALTTTITSDIILALLQHHPVWGSWSLWTYSAWFGITILGHRSRTSTLAQHLVLVLSSSLGFWLWTNFGCWLTMGYPLNASGFITCYSLALPFLSHQLLGDSLWFAACVYAASPLQRFSLTLAKR